MVLPIASSLNISNSLEVNKSFSSFSGSICISMASAIFALIYLFPVTDKAMIIC